MQLVQLLAQPLYLIVSAVNFHKKFQPLSTSVEARRHFAILSYFCLNRVDWHSAADFLQKDAVCMANNLAVLRPKVLLWKKVEQFCLVAQLQIIHLAIQRPATATTTLHLLGNQLLIRHLLPRGSNGRHIDGGVHRLRLGVALSMVIEGLKRIGIKQVVVAEINDE